MSFIILFYAQKKDVALKIRQGTMYLSRADKGEFDVVKLFRIQYAVSIPALKMGIFTVFTAEHIL